jgi:hypothetical protein
MQVLARVLEQVLARVLEQVLARVLEQVLVREQGRVLALDQVLAQVRVLVQALGKGASDLGTEPAMVEWVRQTVQALDLVTALVKAGLDRAPAGTNVVQPVP